MKDIDYMRLVPKRIDKEIKERIDEEVFNDSRYIFIRKEGSKSIGYCTSCKKECELYESHNKWLRCPHCGKNAQVKLTRYKRGGLIDLRTVLFFQKSLKGGKALIGRGFLCKRDYSGDYKKTETEYMEMAMYIFAEDGTSKMYCNLYNWLDDREYRNVARRQSFYRTSSIFSFNINGLANLPYTVDVKSLYMAIKENKFKYCNLNKVYGTDYLRYLETFNKYPIIESLEKIGFGNIVNYKVNKRPLNRQVNWRGKTVTEVLKLNKAQIKEIRESGVEITPGFLKYYRENVKMKYKLNIHELKEIEYLINHNYRVPDILKYTNIKRMYKYAAKQYELRPKEYINYTGVIITWLDYIRDCDELKINIKKNNALYPKDVQVEHNNLQKQIKYKNDKRLEELLKKSNENRKKMGFKYKGLLIRVPRNTSEIIEEGKKMCHCVGGYAERHAKGTTNILFIRKVEDKDTPYYTVEISKEYKIIQVRGKHNGAQTEEVKEFMKVYEKEVLSKLVKNKSKKVKKVV